MSATQALRLLPPWEAREEEPEVVAEILSDETIRTRDPDIRSWVDVTKPGWGTGQVSDGRWILWWQRRRTA